MRSLRGQRSSGEVLPPLAEAAGTRLRGAAVVSGSVPDARPNPRSTRPGCSVDEPVNTSGNLQRRVVGNITPSVSTRILSVAVAIEGVPQRVRAAGASAHRRLGGGPNVHRVCGTRPRPDVHN